jgi:predicted GNAT family acetyltransferase
VTLSAPLFAIIVDGRAVAVCGSVRHTPPAHEAGVETVLEFRRRGFAAEVVASWAGAVRAAGVTPLYSTSWTNTPSQAVARKLGLICFGSDLHLT